MDVIQLSYRDSSKLVTSIGRLLTCNEWTAKYSDAYNAIKIINDSYISDSDYVLCDEISFLSFKLDGRIVNKHIETDNLNIARLLYNMDTSDESKLFLRMKWADRIIPDHYSFCNKYTGEYDPMRFFTDRNY